MIEKQNNNSVKTVFHKKWKLWLFEFNIKIEKDIKK